MKPRTETERGIQSHKEAKQSKDEEEIDEGEASSSNI